MISRRRMLAAGFLSVATMGALILWAVTAQLEPRVVEIEVGPRGEAQRNPLLAAARFLERLDIRVRSEPGHQGLQSLPPTTDTLVLRSTATLSAKQADALAAWMNEGGRLVITVRSPVDGSKPAHDLAARYGVGLGSDGPTGDGPDVEAEIRIEATGQTLRAAFPAGVWLEAADEVEPDLAILADGRARILRRAVGAGSLTLLTDDGFMTNEQIGRLDHALLMAALTTPADGGTLWLLYDPQVPWIGVLLWSAAPLAVVSGTLTLAAWILAVGGRLGPLRTSPPRGRRNLLEHLDASAAFLRRHGAFDELTRRTRRTIPGLRPRRRFAAGPVPETEHGGDRAEWIERPDHRAPGRSRDRDPARASASDTGEDPEDVARALLAPIKDDGDFLRLTILLQRLWREGRRVANRPCAGGSEKARRL